jgi:hypothetical protein
VFRAVWCFDLLYVALGMKFDVGMGLVHAKRQEEENPFGVQGCGGAMVHAVGVPM